MHIYLKCCPLAPAQMWLSVLRSQQDQFKGPVFDGPWPWQAVSLASASIELTVHVAASLYGGAHFYLLGTAINTAAFSTSPASSAILHYVLQFPELVSDASPRVACAEVCPKCPGVCAELQSNTCMNDHRVIVQDGRWLG